MRFDSPGGNHGLFGGRVEQTATLPIRRSWRKQRPFFGASGDIYYMQELSQGRGYVWRMKPDGSARDKVSPDPITYLVNVSPGREMGRSLESRQSD
jgi:hypothetical protein